MARFLELGFLLELYNVDEGMIVFWYLSTLYLQRERSFTKNEQLRQQDAPHDHKKGSHIFDKKQFLVYSILSHGNMARGYSILLYFLRINNFIQKGLFECTTGKDSPWSSPAKDVMIEFGPSLPMLYKHRFGPFEALIKPTFIPFEFFTMLFLNPQDANKPDQEKMMEQASTCLNTAKDSYSRLVQLWERGGGGGEKTDSVVPLSFLIFENLKETQKTAVTMRLQIALFERKMKTLTQESNWDIKREGFPTNGFFNLQNVISSPSPKCFYPNVKLV